MAIHGSYSNTDNGMWAAKYDAALYGRVWNHAMPTVWSDNPDVLDCRCTRCGVMATITASRGRRRIYLDMPESQCKGAK